MQSSLLDVIFHSGPIGQSVLLVLLLCSIVVWAILFAKTREMIQARRMNQKVLAQAQQDSNFEALLAQGGVLQACALTRMLERSQSDLKYFQKHHAHTSLRSANSALKQEFFTLVERSLAATMVHEEKRLGQGQTFLATISVVAPFIGLFGTVVGIIDAFHSIGQLKSVELSVVAPGISEALVATAAGLFTAIPATIGFNVFKAWIREFGETMDHFGLLVMNHLQLQFMGADESHTEATSRKK